MTSDPLRSMINAALGGRRLLDHPFYVRWQRGEVSHAELCSYAGQYRYFEAAFPGFLRGIIERLDHAGARSLLERNLADEAGGPRTHVQLFDDFAAALGAARDVSPTPATAHLLDTYAALVSAGPATGLAAVIAYEMQFPDVAAAKAHGLRRDFGMNAAGLAFWNVHAELDSDHAAWGLEALAALPTGADGSHPAARRAADAWWAFLDEREAARPI